MYSNIMVPVDLAHAEKLEKAINTSAAMAKHFGSSVTLVGVTTTAPSSVAHDPEEFAQKLEAFAAEKSALYDVSFAAHAVTSPDPIRDLDDVLKEQIDEMNADLVIMATHVPALGDYIINSNAGFLVTHTNVSVFVVR